MYKHIVIAQESLSDPRLCAKQIDSLLQQCLLHSRPVYLGLPADMVSITIDAGPLKSPLQVPGSLASSDETAALDLVLDHIHSAKRPMILVDGESRAYGILSELHELITSTKWPVYTSVFGKSCVDESLPNFLGIW